MSNEIRFDVLCDQDKAIACHLISGQRLVIGTESLIAELSNDQPLFCCAKPFHPYTVPEGDLWYAVSIRKINLELGYQKVLKYKMISYPNDHFQLGFSCSMIVHIAHLRGFKQYILQRQDMVYISDLRDIIRNNSTNTVHNAVKRVLSQDYDYSKCIEAKAHIERAVEKSLFKHLFEFGLCIEPHSFSINAFAKPTLNTAYRR